jgi:hypothetical protein
MDIARLVAGVVVFGLDHITDNRQAARSIFRPAAGDIAFP